MIHRWAFNNGEISPSLYFRGDIAKYQSSCKELENFLVTPQGPVTTRWGSECFGRLNNQLVKQEYIRIKTFPFGEDDSFQLVFQSDVPSTSGTNLRIWNGEQFIQQVYTEYKPEHVEDISFYQSYDILYFFHPLYPTMELKRDLSEDVGEQFSLETFQFIGGPFETQNLDSTLIMTVKPQTWLSGTSYTIGDVVSVGANLTLQGSTSLVYLRRETLGFKYYRDHYGTLVELASAVPGGVSAGDIITIESTTDLDGDWEIISIDTVNNTLILNTGTYNENILGVETFYNNFAGQNVNGDIAYSQGKKFTFYTSSLSGTNVGNDPLTTSGNWIPSEYATGDFEIVTNYELFNTSVENSDIGRKIRIENGVRTSDKGIWGTSDEGSTTKVFPGYGTVTLKTEGGIWDGVVVLQESLDGGITWTDLGIISSYDGTANGTITREITSLNSLVRGLLQERGAATADTGCIYYLDVIGTQYSYFTITDVLDSKTVEVTTDNYIWNWPSSFRHSLGILSNTNGYPSTGAIFEERFVIGGIPGRPTDIFMSATNDFSDFVLGTLDTNALQFSLPSGRRQILKWMLAKQELILGTDGGEWTLGSRSIDQGISSTNVRAKQHTSVGSKKVQSILAKELIMYVERGGKSIRGFIYDFAQDGYVTTDFNILASHLTKNSEIKEIEYSAGSTPILWVLLDDNTLLSFSYERNENVSAWARHDVSGEIISIAADIDDSLWLIVKRSDDYFLERIREGNYHIDFYEEFTTLSANALYPLKGANVEAWDDAWIPVNDGVFGVGSFINTLSGQEIKLFDGSDELFIEEDFIKLDGPSGEFCYWVPQSSTLSGGYTVTDLSGNALLSSDFVQYEALSAYTFEILDWDETYDWDNYIVRKGITNLTRATEWFATDRGLGIVPNLDQDLSVLEIAPITKALDVNREVEILPVTQLYSPGNSPNSDLKKFGIKQTSKLITVDLLNSPDFGGPGSTSRTSELEIFVYDSIGGKFRFITDSGYEQDFQPILDVPYNTVFGEELEPFTGMKIVQINSGYQKQGCFLEIQTDNTYHMNIAHTALKTEKYK